MGRRGNSAPRAVLRASRYPSEHFLKFRRAVRPGDQLLIHVKITKSRGNKIGVATGECTVNGNPTASAELMFTVVDEADVN